MSTLKSAHDRIEVLSDLPKHLTVAEMRDLKLETQGAGGQTAKVRGIG